MFVDQMALLDIPRALLLPVPLDAPHIGAAKMGRTRVAPLATV